MQAMLAAFITLIEDLEDIEGMLTTIQVISFFVSAIVAIIILYQIFK